MGATAAQPLVAGYYSPEKVELLKSDPSVLVLESYLYTAVHHKIVSKYQHIVWELTEDRFEDHTSIEISGPEAVIWRMEDGGTNWGYNNGAKGLSIFIMDDGPLREALSGADFRQFDFPFDALIVDDAGPKAYRCHFSPLRLKDVQSLRLVAGPQRQAAGYSLIFNITKFLSSTGIDLSKDRCTKDDQFLVLVPGK